ncbi:short chain type dehydrogenase [Hysterangium stoloniferum]|nr:short chain type dehydrogenase [Hysterangium stoloniferum]
MPISDLPLKGKVAIVTGASRSIGAGIASRLAQDGASVVVNYVNSTKDADEVVNAIIKEGKGDAMAVKADIGTSAGRQHLIDETIKAWKKIDVLVNNAGVMDSKPLAQVDEAQFDHTFNVNVKSPLFLTQEAVKHMGPGSRIIFFSSSLTKATTIQPFNLVYAGSKGAIEQFTRALSKDLATKLITVNCVSPGPIDTTLFRNGKSDSLIKMIESTNPHGRLGTVDEVKGVVAFLAGPEAAWVSGQNIRINGAYAV